MRLTLLTAAVALALAGCGKQEAEGAGNRSDEAITAEDFSGNDVTAIDAASGADANMAADVDFNALDNDSAGNSSARDRTGTRRGSRPAAASNATAPPDNAATEPAPAPEPAETNSN